MCFLQAVPSSSRSTGPHGQQPLKDVLLLPIFCRLNDPRISILPVGHSVMSPLHAGAPCLQVLPVSLLKLGVWPWHESAVRSMPLWRLGAPLPGPREVTRPPSVPEGHPLLLDQTQFIATCSP